MDMDKCNMMVGGPIWGLGVMDGGMAVGRLVFKMEIRIVVNIDSINDMDVERIVGPMEGSMMENSWMRNGTGRERFRLQMVPDMKVTSIKGSEKGMGPIILRMEVITLETGSKDAMKGLEVRLWLVSFDFHSGAGVCHLFVRATMAYVLCRCCA